MSSVLVFLFPFHPFLSSFRVILVFSSFFLAYSSSYRHLLAVFCPFFDAFFVNFFVVFPLSYCRLLVFFMSYLFRYCIVFTLSFYLLVGFSLYLVLCSPFVEFPSSSRRLWSWSLLLLVLLKLSIRSSLHFMPSSFSLFFRRLLVVLSSSYRLSVFSSYLVIVFLLSFRRYFDILISFPRRPLAVFSSLFRCVFFSSCHICRSYVIFILF